MKPQATDASPTRPRRRARTRRRFWFAPLLLTPLALGATFIVIARSLALTVPTVAPDSPENRRRASESARNTSLNRALKGLNGETLRAYLDRNSRPDAPRRAGQTAQSARVDVEALARRHPAWQLADALQNGVLEPAAAREIALTSRFAAAQNPNAARDARSDDGASRARRRLTSRVDASANRGAAADRDFLSDLAARGAARRRDEALLARRALEDDIANAERAQVEFAELSGVSPELALELTNLRLLLGRDVANSDAQRQSARERIAQIEARLSATWKQQSAANQERLRVALEEGPARLRREGLARIEADAARRRATDSLALAALRRDLQRAQLLERAQRSSLALDLPPARGLEASNPTTLAPQTPDFVETRSGAMPSNPPQTPLVLGVASPNALDSQIDTLRALARRDAARFARESRVDARPKVIVAPIAKPLPPSAPRR